MRWSTACRNPPDETPWMRAMQSAADPDRSALEQTGRNLQWIPSLFRGGSAPPSPTLSGWTACRGSAFLQRTAPALVRASPIGQKMMHTLIWRAARTKRSVPIFGPRQSETLRDHIWCEIHTAWGMEYRTHLHAGEHAKSVDNGASRVLLSLLLVMYKS